MGLSESPCCPLSCHHRSERLHQTDSSSCHSNYVDATGPQNTPCLIDIMNYCTRSMTAEMSIIMLFILTSLVMAYTFLFKKIIVKMTFFLKQSVRQRQLE